MEISAIKGGGPTLNGKYHKKNFIFFLTLPSFHHYLERIGGVLVLYFLRQSFPQFRVRKFLTNLFERKRSAIF